MVADPRVLIRAAADLLILLIRAAADLC